MNRMEFVSKCGLGCLAIIVPGVLLQGCSGPKYLSAPIEDSHLVVPLSAFEIKKDNDVTGYRSYLIVENESLKYPICIYRTGNESYSALWMRCTHQGTELHVFGDRLQCPAHGSEFTRSGAVQNGPAAEPLRTFVVNSTSTSLKISMQ